MQFIISVLLSGIAVGGQYALIAIGYTMVYGILRLINFAHGDVFMVAGLMVHLCLGDPAAATSPCRSCSFMTVVLGFLIERLAYKPLRTAPRMSVMISAIGVSYFLQNTATYITGGQPMVYPEISWLTKTVTIAGTPTKLRRAHHARARDPAGARPDAAHQPHEGRHGHARRLPRLRDGPAHGHQDQLRHLRDVHHRLGAGGDRLDPVLHQLPRRERPPPVRCPA